MKLVRYGPPGAEKPGLIDSQGRIRDLSAIVDDIGPAQLAPGVLARLRTLDAAALPLASGAPRIGPCVAGSSKFIAIGLNYSDHAAESGMPAPEEPVIFMKATSCISGPYDPIIMPPGSRKTDWEAELGVVIGRRAKYVEREQALDHVAGYCVVNDVSEREYQLERGGTWDKGKGFDTFGPIGPYLVTTDEVRDPQNLDIWLDIDGRRMQTGNTRTMIFDVATLVSYVSHCMTLVPGDIITTGTPPGVRLGMKPPRYLRPGEVVTLGIAGLGEQRQEVCAFAG